MQKANKLIVVNAAPYETRVATLESGILVELLIEGGEDRNSVGNIYNGKVIRVLPGMQAAFVDIGMDKAGFLFAGDFVTPQLDLDTDPAPEPVLPEEMGIRPARFPPAAPGGDPEEERKPRGPRPDPPGTLPVPARRAGPVLLGERPDRGRLA